MSTYTGTMVTLKGCKIEGRMLGVGETIIVNDPSTSLMLLTQGLAVPAPSQQAQPVQRAFWAPGLTDGYSDLLANDVGDYSPVVFRDGEGGSATDDGGIESALDVRFKAAAGESITFWWENMPITMPADCDADLKLTVAFINPDGTYAAISGALDAFGAHYGAPGWNAEYAWGDLTESFVHTPMGTVTTQVPAGAVDANGYVIARPVFTTQQTGAAITVQNYAFLQMDPIVFCGQLESASVAIPKVLFHSQSLFNTGGLGIATGREGGNVTETTVPYLTWFKSIAAGHPFDYQNLAISGTAIDQRNFMVTGQSRIPALHDSLVIVSWGGYQDMVDAIADSPGDVPAQTLFVTDDWDLWVSQTRATFPNAKIVQLLIPPLATTDLTAERSLRDAINAHWSADTSIDHTVDFYQHDIDLYSTDGTDDGMVYTIHRPTDGLHYEEAGAETAATFLTSELIRLGAI